MAITVSGLYLATWIDIVDATQLAVDLSLATNKLAMFTNSITPNYSSDTAYGVAPYNANQVSGTGYTAGGTAVTSPTITESPTGTLMYDAADTQWAGSTITNARGGLIYADALAGDNAIVFINFGADYSTVAGLFLVMWNALGIATIDLTP